MERVNGGSRAPRPWLSGSFSSQTTLPPPRLSDTRTSRQSDEIDRHANNTDRQTRNSTNTQRSAPSTASGTTTTALLLPLHPTNRLIHRPTGTNSPLLYFPPSSLSLPPLFSPRLVWSFGDNRQDGAASAPLNVDDDDGGGGSCERIMPERTARTDRQTTTLQSILAKRETSTGGTVSNEYACHHQQQQEGTRGPYRSCCLEQSQTGAEGAQTVAMGQEWR